MKKETEVVTKQNMIIIFRGIPERREFQDILAYQLGSGFLGVQQKDGTMFIFPSDRIEEVIYTQE
jgi:hypothetical protein